MVFRWLKPVGLAALMALTASTASADEVTLTFATTLPAQSPVNAEVHHAWAQRINEAGKGIVRIDVRDGPTIANAINAYDRVASDVVQISHVPLSYVAGKFPLRKWSICP